METNIDKGDKRVASMFNNIAHSYDFVNHILSFNMDKKWRKQLVKRLPTNHSIKVLDVATGTGDLAIMMAKRCKGAKIRAVDISENMLEIAKKKAYKAKVDDKILFNNANVESLPFEDNTFNYCTISFGIRNFENIDKSLKEIYRCLKPGGKLFILEFGKKPSSKLLQFFYKIYLKVWIPFVGGLLSRNMRAYKYLPESISEFVHRRELSRQLKNIGFGAVNYKKLSNGIVIFYEGVKL